MNNFSNPFYIIFTLLIYIALVYFIPNWMAWNFIFEGRFFGLIFIMGLVFFLSLYVSKVIFKLTIMKTTLLAILALFTSFYFYDISTTIGKYQVVSKLKNIKIHVDDFNKKKGRLPINLAEIEENGIHINKNMPLFLIFSGELEYKLNENNTQYTIDINTIRKGGDLGMYINEKGEIQSYDI